MADQLRKSRRRSEEREEIALRDCCQLAPPGASMGDGNGGVRSIIVRRLCQTPSSGVSQNEAAGTRAT